MWKTALVLAGVQKDGRLSWRQRLDFGIIGFVSKGSLEVQLGGGADHRIHRQRHRHQLFTVIVGFFDALLTFTNQISEPVGYSSDMAGYIGAAVILSGLLACVR